MYPCSLSRSLIQELGPESRYPNKESLLRKLEEKPKRLVDFLMASYQSMKWEQQNGGFRAVLYKNITVNVLNGRLDFDETMARLSQIFKFYVSQVHLETFVDYAVQAQGKSIFMSKLLLMRASPVLKARFFSNPEVKRESLQDVAPYLLHIEELANFYALLYSNDYSGFVNLSTGFFQRILFQCKDWQCPQLDELQRMLCKRIIDYYTATGELALAHFMGLTLLEDKCRAFLDDAQFLVHKSKETGFDNYILNDPVVVDKTAKELYSPQELLEMSSKLRSSSYEGSLRILVDRIFLTFQNDHSLAVGCMKVQGADTMQPLQRWTREFPEAKMDKASVTTLGADATYKLPDISLIGILLYFEKVNKLDLCKYNEISAQFLEKLKLKRNLTHLSIIDYKGCIDTLLPLVSKMLPNVEALEIWSKPLKKETLGCILKKPNLKDLILVNCPLELPEDANAFNAIERLTLFPFASPSHVIQAFITFCRNLQYLKIDGKNALFIFPKSLKVLVISSGLLEYQIKHGYIPDAGLEELHIVGDLNLQLSTFFINLNAKFSTHFHNNYM